MLCDKEHFRSFWISQEAAGWDVCFTLWTRVVSHFISDSVLYILLSMSFWSHLLFCASLCSSCMCFLSLCVWFSIPFSFYWVVSSVWSLWVSFPSTCSHFMLNFVYFFVFCPILHPVSVPTARFVINCDPLDPNVSKYLFCDVLCAFCSFVIILCNL